MRRIIALIIYILIALTISNGAITTSNNILITTANNGEIAHSYKNVYNGEFYISFDAVASSPYKQPYYYPATFIFYNRPMFLEQNGTLAKLKNIGQGLLFKPLNNPANYNPKIAPIIVMDGASLLPESYPGVYTAYYLKYSAEATFGEKYNESEQKVFDYFLDISKILTIIMPSSEDVFSGFQSHELKMYIVTPSIVYYTEFNNPKISPFVLDTVNIKVSADGDEADLVVVLSPVSVANYNEYLNISNDYNLQNYNGSWLNTCELMLWHGVKACVGSLMFPDTFKAGRETYKGTEITYEVPSVFAIPAMQWLEKFYSYLAAGDTVEEAANKAYMDTAYYFNTALDLIIEISYITNQISSVLDMLDGILDNVTTNIKYLLQISTAIENLELLLTADAYNMFYNYVTSTVTSNTITSLVHTLGLTSQSIVYGFMKMLQIKVTGTYGPAIRVYGDLDYRLEPPPSNGGGGGGYPGAPNLPMSRNNGRLSG